MRTKRWAGSMMIRPASINHTRRSGRRNQYFACRPCLATFLREVLCAEKSLICEVSHHTSVRFAPTRLRHKHDTEESLL
jgi:hypothetical protein